ncbi:hypothetical protein E2C01_003507 [Portunus trituberculatus]|uniref:Uncharacterized protein n=1 Tax=Portunus trituberculatus TaxID=210409 RepID=A0A5B7CTR4_PORTR|nr:hypothetical protein [Portunus trituberculatus]
MTHNFPGDAKPQTPMLRFKSRQQQHLVSCRVRETVEACLGDLQPLGDSGSQHKMAVLPAAPSGGRQGVSSVAVSPLSSVVRWRAAAATRCRTTENYIL